MSAMGRQFPTFAPDAQKVVWEDEASLSEASPIVRKRPKGWSVSGARGKMIATFAEASTILRDMVSPTKAGPNL
jgi:hypothetical protein